MRERIIDAALEAYAASDSRGPTFKAIAESVDLSEKGLAHYFASRDELLLAVLQERDRLDAALPEPEDDQWLSHLVQHVAARNITRPGLVKLYLDMAVAASDPTHPAHTFFVERYNTLRDGLEMLLVRHGEDRDSARLDAATILAAADGLQIQWLLDPSIDLTAAVVRLTRTIESGAAGARR